MKLTKAELKALEMVRDGNIRRAYEADGNHFRRLAGISATTLWRLDRKGLIADDDTKMVGGVMTTEVGVRLTPAGARALPTE